VNQIYDKSLLVRIRIILSAFVFVLLASGVTTLALETGVGWAKNSYVTLQFPAFEFWLLKVHEALAATNDKYPFLAYGTDWLAFAHFVIAIAFIGPLRDPVRNIWVVQFGMLACILVVPFALMAGSVRGIPLGWRMLDCLFGVIGLPVLYVCYNWIQKLAAMTAKSRDYGVSTLS